MDPFTLEKLEFGRILEILARYCRCSLGRELALRIAPSRRPETVQAWLAQTDEMVGTLREVGTPPFGGITDIRPQLERARPAGGAGPEDFAAIASTLAGCGQVRNWLASLGENRPLLHKLEERLSSFDGEIRAIQMVIDERGEVRDDASERLLNIRRQIEEAQRRIREIVYGFVRRGDVAQYLQSTNVQLHEDRYVLPVRAEHRGRLPGVVHRSSHTGATVFVEPAECVELNNRLVRLHDEQREEINRLLSQLAIRVHARYEEIVTSLHALALVDLIAAKAQYSYVFEMTAPEVAPGGPLRFFQARHPLLIEQAYQQEQAGAPPERRHPVVPIDVRLGQDFDILIITGSNTGGKTVAMKTVGLLALMVQSGMHVPVQRGSTMPVFRDVLIDVGDEQSLEQSLSTFGAHLQRIRAILRVAGRQSLVLLDELGSGTDPDEGGALGQAILDELRELGCLAMVTTHLGVLKAYAFNHERADNGSVEFDTGTLRPTYRLLIGQPGESHAIVVAEHYGLPRRLLKAARGHLPRQARQLHRAIQATLDTRRASENALSEAQAARAAAQTQQELYEARLNALQRLNEQFSEWVASLPAMQPGDEVHVRRFSKTGRLVRLQLSRQVALVDVDQMQVEVPLQELMPDLGQPQVREEIATLRRQIRENAKLSDAARAEAEKARQEYRRNLEGLRQRQRHFDAWREALGKVSVGDEVTFSAPPGRGRVTALDLPTGKISVETPRGPLDVRLADLFPETRPGPGGRRPAPRGRTAPPPREREDRPVVHRDPQSRTAKASREAVLATPPGEQVYVVPFRKRATLLRVDAAKDLAVVLSGAFEMQVPLADVEPVQATPTQKRDRPQRPRRERRPEPEPAPADAQPPPEQPEGEVTAGGGEEAQQA